MKAGSGRRVKKAKLGIVTGMIYGCYMEWVGRGDMAGLEPRPNTCELTVLHPPSLFVTEMLSHFQFHIISHIQHKRIVWKDVLHILHPNLDVFKTSDTVLSMLNLGQYYKKYDHFRLNFCIPCFFNKYNLIKLF